ncbi:MAG UNVERIFIED_CONTAM: hypothetical protein LVR29_22445 [Microcystis novacekii LVE1205-3]|jgi:hypothetical protein
MYKVIFIIITITISSASCAESGAFNQSFITAGELAEQAFFGITDADMQKTSHAQQEIENKKLFALRDEKLKNFLATMFNNITKKETFQEKLPLMMQVAAKFSGYNPPIHKIARINYLALNTDEYKSTLKKTFLPFISDDFSPILYQTFKEALSLEEERTEGIELTDLIRVACENHKHRIQQEKYDIIFDPDEEVLAIAVLINLFFQTAEEKFALEKKSS